MKSRLNTTAARRCGVGLLLAGFVFLPALGQDLSTSFEFNDTDGSFTLGTAPKTVTFAGFQAKTVGQLSLYRSGLNSAMVAAGQTGTITFETPAGALQFFFKDQTSTVQSLLRLLDESGQVVQSFNGSTNFTEVNLTNTRAKSITLENRAPAAGASLYTVIDDFSFTAAEQVAAAAPALVFPQFANGEAGGQANRTRLVLRQTSSEAVSGQIRFADGEGNPVQVPVNGQIVNTLDFSLSPFGTFDVETDGTGPLISGVLEVAVDAGDASRLEGSVVFGILGNFVSIQAAPVRNAHQVYVSVNSVENTGAALFNPDPSTPATLQVVLLNNEGQTQASGTVVLQPREQLVAFVDEASFFPAFFAGGGPFQGTLNISVAQGPAIAATGLLQQRSDGALIAVATSENAFIP